MPTTPLTPNRNFFISHSVQDRELADDFLSAIRDCFKLSTEGFIASRLDRVEQGADGFSQIHEELAKAHLCIALITPHSICSQWVFYELGYSKALEISEKHNGIQRRVLPLVISVNTDLFQTPVRGLSHFKIADQTSILSLMASIATFWSKNSAAQKKANEKIAARLFQKIHPKLNELKQIRHVNTASEGITAIFPGKIEDATLRSLTSAQKNIVAVGPTLAKPLESHRQFGLRNHLLRAIARNVNVNVFIINPLITLKASQRDHISGQKDCFQTFSEIQKMFPESYSMLALESLKEMYSTLKTNTEKSRLRVFIVDKASLDFTIMIDEAYILCRSTIQWTAHHKSQKRIERIGQYDYKPPILELKVNSSEQSLEQEFCIEYMNYVHDLLYSAGFDIERPFPDLVHEMFPVTELTEALNGHTNIRQVEAI